MRQGKLGPVVFTKDGTKLQTLKKADSGAILANRHKTGTHF
jgi:hypothetical protein